MPGAAAGLPHRNGIFCFPWSTLAHFEPAGGDGWRPHAFIIRSLFPLRVPNAR